MMAVFIALLAVLLASSMPAGAESVVLGGQVVLGETRLDGKKLGEFSALIRAPDGSDVLAISDRGYIARLRIAIADGRLVRVEPVSIHPLTGPDGAAMRGRGFNPEAAALLDDGSIAIASESGPRLAVFDANGRWLRDELLPEQVRDAARQASPKDGIESLAWTARTGFLAMTEEPQAGQPRNLHRLHSTLAGSTTFSTRGADSTSIKAMEAVGDRLFILERTRDNTTRAMAPWLRIVDLPACLGKETCPAPLLPIPVSGLPDADFEGLVALDNGSFLMVSDDRVGNQLRSVFVLFRVE